MADSNRHGAIWDVDGTLVDTAELHFEAWVQLARELDKPFDRAAFVATFGRRNPEIIHQLFGQQFSDKEVTHLGNRKEELYRDAARKGVELLPGVLSLLKGLHQAGWKQAIGSSAPRRNLQLILDLTRTTQLFDAVVAMEDTERGKPDPQVFQVAAARLNIPPQRCVVLEDAVAGVQAARAGGMKCIAIRHAGHHPEAALREAGADLVVDSLEKVSAQSMCRLFATT
jgi:beta-phosphoglucomutase